MRPALLLQLAFLRSILASGQEEWREFTFASGHKTGTSFSRSVSACLVPKRSPEWNWRTIEEWLAVVEAKDEGFHPKFPMEWGRVVLMVRHPYDLAVSNYFYSLDCANRPGCLQREKNMLLTAGEVGLGKLALYGEEPKPHETFYMYIHRVNMVDAITATMEADALPVIKVQDIVATNDPNRVLMVCLGDVFRAFNKTVSSILDHLGIAAGKKLWDCLAPLDPSKRQFYHGTHKVDMTLRMMATRMIRDLDAKHFDGQFSSSLFATRCKEEGQHG